MRYLLLVLLLFVVPAHAGMFQEICEEDFPCDPCEVAPPEECPECPPYDGTPLYFRYWDNGDGSVRDMKDNLLWDTGEIGRLNQTDGAAYCDGLTLGGYSWQLPTKTQLSGIVDRQYSPIALDPIFADAKNASYWTNSQYTPGGPYIHIYMADGYETTSQGESLIFVRCVSEDLQ